MRALALAALAALDARAEPFRIAVISDLNGYYGSTDYAPDVDAAVARIIGTAPDVVISAGDMVAEQRRAPPLSEGGIETMWAAFHARVTDRLRAAGLPLLVTPGNHDASADRIGRPGAQGDRDRRGGRGRKSGGLRPRRAGGRPTDQSRRLARSDRPRSRATRAYVALTRRRSSHENLINTA